MGISSAVSLMLSALIGLVLALLTWGLLRHRRQKADVHSTSHDGTLLALRVLAAFALGSS
jgi:Ca2+/H+ antiporter